MSRGCQRRNGYGRADQSNKAIQLRSEGSDWQQHRG